LEAAALAQLGASALTDSSAQIAQHLEQLIQRAKGGVSATALVAAFTVHQIQTVACDPIQLDEMIVALLDDLCGMRMMETGEPAFPNATGRSRTT
jgi:hypothetical protein